MEKHIKEMLNSGLRNHNLPLSNKLFSISSVNINKKSKNYMLKLKERNNFQSFKISILRSKNNGNSFYFEKFSQVFMI